MTIDEYISLLRQPSLAGARHVQDLERMVHDMPYCSTAHILLLCALYHAGDVRFGTQLSRSVVYAPSARILYNALNSTSSSSASNNTTHISSGNYFDMMNRLEEISKSEDVTLQDLVRRLFQQLPSTEEAPHAAPVTPLAEQARTPEAPSHTTRPNEADAIELLRRKYLNNPKKSIYFADQIRFLETARRYAVRPEADK